MCKRFALVFTEHGIVNAVECDKYLSDDLKSVGWEQTVELIGGGCKYFESFYHTHILQSLKLKFGVKCYINEEPVGLLNPFSPMFGCPIYGQVVCLSIKDSPYTDYLSLSGVNAVCKYLEVTPEFTYLDEMKKFEVCDGKCAHYQAYALRDQCGCGYEAEEKPMYTCDSCKGFRHCGLFCQGNLARHKKLCAL